MLADKGGDVSAQNDAGDTPLHYACSERHEQMVHFLAGRGADVNIQNKYGNTPLHYACFWGHEAISLFLVKNGAKITIRNTNGESPYSRATGQLKQLLENAAHGVKRRTTPPDGVDPMTSMHGSMAELHLSNDGSQEGESSDNGDARRKPSRLQIVRREGNGGRSHSSGTLREYVAPALLCDGANANFVVVVAQIPRSG